MSSNYLDQDEILEMQNLLLDWFEINQRIFPWRITDNSFHILVAEKLLQQTATGERVVVAYKSIINDYPDPFSMAHASIEDLNKIVYPLGLHYRAQELIILATLINSQFPEGLPNDYESLIRLPGVGEYSARAILSFAFNENIAIVDTNVARFLYRLWGLDILMPANPARNKLITNLATSIIPFGKSRSFNFAILDLSAVICKVKNPICELCPVNKFCAFSHSI